MSHGAEFSDLGGCRILPSEVAGKVIWREQPKALIESKLRAGNWISCDNADVARVLGFSKITFWPREGWMPRGVARIARNCVLPGHRRVRAGGSSESGFDGGFGFGWGRLRG